MNKARWHRQAQTILFLVAVLLPAGVARAAEGTVSVAVLPFGKISPRAEDSYLEAGFAETLTTALARVRTLQLIERGQIKRVLEELKLAQSGLIDETKAAKVGKMLGARQVLAGSFQRAGETMRVTCRFVDAETGEVDAEHTAIVTGQLAHEEDIFKLQDDVVAAVLKSFSVNATSRERDLIVQVTHATRRSDAFRFYTEAREKYLQFTPEGYRAAAELYKKAIGDDAEYALAYAGLAEVQGAWGYEEQQQGIDASSRFRDSLESAKKAVKLAPELGEAHRSLAEAYLRTGEEGDTESQRRRRCERSARKAIEINERDAEAWFCLWEGVGRPLTGEGREHIERALEINPKLTVAHNNLATTLSKSAGERQMAGDMEQASKLLHESEEHQRIVTQLNPRSASAWCNLGFLYVQENRASEARKAFDKATEIDPGMPFIKLGMGEVFERQGNFMEAARIYEKLKQTHPKFPMGYFKMGTLLAIASMQRFDLRPPAIENLRKFLELARGNPTYDEGVRNVEDLLRKMGAEE